MAPWGTILSVTLFEIKLLLDIWAESQNKKLFILLLELWGYKYLKIFLNKEMSGDWVESFVYVYSFKRNYTYCGIFSLWGLPMG